MARFHQLFHSIENAEIQRFTFNGGTELNNRSILAKIKNDFKALYPESHISIIVWTDRSGMICRCLDIDLHNNDFYHILAKRLRLIDSTIRTFEKQKANLNMMINDLLLQMEFNGTYRVEAE